MTQTVIESLVTILVIAGITFLIRAFPFLVFRSHKPLPKFVTYLGRVLPFAVIGMLVVYCLRGTSVFAYPYGIPEAVSILVIVLVHKWKHNMLLSIGGGTVLYMLLVQLIFIA